MNYHYYFAIYSAEGEFLFAEYTEHDAKAAILKLGKGAYYEEIEND